MLDQLLTITPTKTGYYIIEEPVMYVNGPERNTRKYLLGLKRATEKSRSVRSAALSSSLKNRVLCSM
jgi:hypothetical protein